MHDSGDALTCIVDHICAFEVDEQQDKAFGKMTDGRQLFRHSKHLDLIFKCDKLKNGVWKKPTTT